MPDLADLFPGFAAREIDTSIGKIFARLGGSGPPLLLLHGYTETHVMWHRVATALAARFALVIADLPGYGFSGPTRHKGFNYDKAGAVNAALMARLGYARYGAQGGDWGSAISSSMAQTHPDRVIALHLNLINGRPADPHNPHAGLDADERANLAWKDDYNLHESAYQFIQATKPQSLAYGLTDSPAGLAAWIVEKFRTWSDCGARRWSAGW